MNLLHNRFPFFLSLVILNFLNYCTYGIPVTYFPQVAKQKGLMDYAIGIIFAMYPLFSFILSFAVVKLLNKWDRRTVIKCSEITLGLSTLLFGFSVYFSNQPLFILTALIGRGIQGMSIGAYITSSYAYVPEYWPDEIDQRITILEMFLSCGIGCGPLLGSFLYEIWGYITIYIVPGVLILVIGLLLSHFVFPIKEKPLIKQVMNNNGDEKQEVLHVGESFRIKEILYSMFVVVNILTTYTWIMPEFENKVIDLHHTPQIASLIFSMQSLGYVSGSITQLIVRCQNRQGLFFLSLVCNLFCLCLLGLDEFVQMDEFFTLISMGAGLFILGWAFSLSLLPFISEAFLILKKNFPDRQEQAMSNMASAMFNVGISLAEFQGPIIGGVLEDFIGFSQACLVFAGVSFVYFVAFATHGKGFIAFKEFFKKKKMVVTPGEQKFLGEMLLMDGVDKGKN